MNRLPLEKRTAIIQLLVEGNSLRSITRIMDVSIHTVINLLVSVGRACMEFHENHIVNIKADRIQADEMWSFVYSEQKNTPEDSMTAGDAWTWIAMDADTKLIISWLVGGRDSCTAQSFMQDLAYRLDKRVQLTTDGLKKYVFAVDEAFGEEIDYAQVVKRYGTKEDDKRHQYLGSDKKVVTGEPIEKFISTSYLERQKLTIRMGSKRFARKTNAFSKKFENHCYALAIQFVYYNFGRVHMSLRVTPAMQTGITKRVMKIEEIVALADSMETKKGLFKIQPK